MKYTSDFKIIPTSPIQSIKQLKSWLSIVALLIGAGLILDSAANLNLPKTTMILSIIAGSSISLILCIPATLQIHPRSPSLEASITEKLLNSGYQKEKPESTQQENFSLIGPEWMKWNESNVTIDLNEKILTITGPVSIVNSTKNHLKRNFKQN